MLSYLAAAFKILLKHDEIQQLSDFLPLCVVETQLSRASNCASTPIVGLFTDAMTCSVLNCSYINAAPPPLLIIIIIALRYICAAPLLSYALYAFAAGAISDSLIAKGRLSRLNMQKVSYSSTGAPQLLIRR